MSDVRADVLAVLERIESRQAWATPLLAEIENAFPARERSILHERTLGILRWRGRIDAMLEQISERQIMQLDSAVRQALRLGYYELRFCDGVPDYAAVNGAVEAVRRRGVRSASGLVNAVLRKVVRLGVDADPPRPREGDLDELVTWSSHPRVWLERAVDHLGWEETLRCVEVHQQPAPTFLRINAPAGSNPAEVRNELAEDGVPCVPIEGLPEACRVESGNVSRSRAFAEGKVWIQDLSSQWTAALLAAGAMPGGRALDICAAPGGKAFDLAARGVSVLAMDINPQRLRTLRERAGRLGLPGITAVAADGCRPAWSLAAGFDRVLVDAPCSGTGTFRRRPESRWRFDPATLPRLSERQSRLLETASTALTAGGQLVYAVCSAEPEEGPQVVDAFLAAHAEFRVIDAAERLPEAAHRHVRNGYLAPRVETEGGESFFAALLERRATIA